MSGQQLKEKDEDILNQEVDFDTWYMIRKNSIPDIHHKEIIKADFKGRGLKKLESVNTFDAALTKYGVKL